MIFEAFRRFYICNETTERYHDCARVLVDNVVNRRMSIGPQRAEFAVSEDNLSARFASILQHIFSSELCAKSLVPMVEVGHQNKVEDQFMDVTLFHSTTDGLHPRVVFEFTVNDTNKQFQLHAYISNADAMLPENLHLIALGAVVHLPPGDAIPTILFYGYYKVYVQESGKLVAKVCNVLLFKDRWNVDTLTRILRVCDWFVKLPMSTFELPATGLPQEKWPTVLFSSDGSTVFKSYDYRRSAYAGSRDSTLALKYIPNCRSIFCDSDLDKRCVVIEYPKIEGEHAPPNNRSAIGVIDGLRMMHEDGNLHLDVKAGNCVFNSIHHNRSALIDFDLSRPVTNAKYPKSYELNIADGQRHPDAVPGEFGSVDHDTFALAAVLKFSRAVKEELRSEWDRVCNLVEAGQLADAVEELRRQDQYDLELKPKSAVTFSATGSPIK